MASILDYSDEPRFNINSVAKLTSMQPVTIRAWERRYQLVVPKRAANGYRLYSERDIAILRWAKRGVEQGYPISTVNSQLKDAIKKNDWPEAVLSDKSTVAVHPARTINRSELVQNFSKALIRHDERMSSDLFADALGSLKLADLFESILIPALVDIGDRWERGEIGVATEHFASQFIQTKIMAIYQSLPLHPSCPKLIIGCAPDELHEIGPMMLATLLRDAGYKVEYLGPDLPLDDLLIYVREEMPKMLILSATMKASAEDMIRFSEKLSGLKPSVAFGFGGAAFILFPDLQLKINGHYLGPSISESIKKINDLFPLKNK